MTGEMKGAQEQVRVPQADRDAVNYLRSQLLYAANPEISIEDCIEQAFARHRQAAEAASRAEVERLWKALAEIADMSERKYTSKRLMGAKARSAISASDGEEEGYPESPAIIAAVGDIFSAPDEGGVA